MPKPHAPTLDRTILLVRGRVFLSLPGHTNLPEAVLQAMHRPAVAIGNVTSRTFRVAHMKHADAPVVLGTLGASETAFAALGLPHGDRGAQAAVTALGRHFSGAA